VPPYNYNKTRNKQKVYRKLSGARKKKSPNQRLGRWRTKAKENTNYQN